MTQIYDVTLRDGFQNLESPIPTGVKIEILERLSNAGLYGIEVGSFPSLRAERIYGNMRDTAEVFNKAKKREGTKYCALVPGQKYFQQAVDAGFNHVAVVIFANEKENQDVLHRSIDESIQGIMGIKGSAEENGIKVRVYLSAAFGNRNPRDVTLKQLEYVAWSVSASELDETTPDILIGDVYEVSFGDTPGVARYGKGFRRRLKCMDAIQANKPATALHIHQSDPEIWENIVMNSIEKDGINIFDSSLCGLGGCKTGRGYMGNLPTAELIDFLDGNRYDTGIDSDEVHRVAELVHKTIKKTK